MTWLHTTFVHINLKFISIWARTCMYALDLCIFAGVALGDFVDSVEPDESVGRLIISFRILIYIRVTNLNYVPNAPSAKVETRTCTPIIIIINCCPEGCHSWGMHERGWARRCRNRNRPECISNLFQQLCLLLFFPLFYSPFAPKFLIRSSAWSNFTCGEKCLFDLSTICCYTCAVCRQPVSTRMKTDDGIFDNRKLNSLAQHTAHVCVCVSAAATTSRTVTFMNPL